MASLAAIANGTESEAEAHEAEFRRLALLLFALEFAVLARAIARADSDAAVVEVLRAARTLYRAPNGLFRRQWEDRFAALMQDVATRGRRRLPVVGQRVEAPLMPRAAARAIETQAAELANAVTQVSARRIEAVTQAVGAELLARQQQTPLRLSAFEQRLETLAPLVGRTAAEEIMAVVADSRGRSLQKVATEMTERVHATDVTRPRADMIARNETLGLVNTTEYERAVSTGVLREHRWISQGDVRVRDSHRTCEAQGWIPITERFANGLLHPHERPAPPEEIINCRCSQAFRAGSESVVVPPRTKPATPPLVELPPPRVPAERAPEPARARERVSVLRGGSRDTLAEHTEGGRLTPERQALHRRIVDDYFRESGATPVAKPVVNTMGGGGASGKSSVQAKLRLPKNRITADPDLVRTKLPEWERELAAARAEGRPPNQKLAAYTHEEASLINKQIIEKATTQGYNLLIDGVGGGGIEKLSAKVAGWRASGSPVKADYVTIDYDIALKRMRERYARTGRYILEDVLQQQHETVANTFYDAIQRGLFDEFTLWDNSGSGPVIVARGRGTQLQIFRKDLWDRFVVRAKGFETTGR